MIGRGFIGRTWREALAMAALSFAAIVAGAAGAAETDAVGVPGAESSHPSPYDTYQGIATNGDAMVAVGSGRTLLRSADGGESWTPVALPVYVGLIDVDTCPDNTFLALDYYGRVWKGDANGEAWEQSELPGDITPMASACNDAGEYWVVGSGSQYLRSSDRGSNWQVNDLGGRDIILTEVEFTGGGDGYIFGEFGLALRTKDGGENWAELPELPKGFYVYDALFQSANRGFLAGRGGNVLATTDGGATWAMDRSGGLPLYGLAADSAGRVYGVGEVGTVHRRAAPGDWQQLPDIQLNGFLRAGLFINPSAERLVVVGGDTGKATPVKLELDQ